MRDRCKYCDGINKHCKVCCDPDCGELEKKVEELEKRILDDGQIRQPGLAIKHIREIFDEK